MLPERVTDFLLIKSNKKIPSREDMLGCQYQLKWDGYCMNIGKAYQESQGKGIHQSNAGRSLGLHKRKYTEKSLELYLNKNYANFDFTLCLTI